MAKTLKIIKRKSTTKKIRSVKVSGGGTRKKKLVRKRQRVRVAAGGAGKVNLTNARMTMYVAGKEQKKKLVFFSITEGGLLYLSRDNNRKYWHLSKIKKSDRPKIKFVDSKNTINIGNNRIVIKKSSDYENSKRLLQPFV